MREGRRFDRDRRTICLPYVDFKAKMARQRGGYDGVLGRCVRIQYLGWFE